MEARNITLRIDTKRLAWKREPQQPCGRNALRYRTFTQPRREYTWKDLSVVHNNRTISFGSVTYSNKRVDPLTVTVQNDIPSRAASSVAYSAG